MRLSLASFQPIRTFSEATDMVEPIFQAVHTTILVHTATWSPPGGRWWLVVRPPSLWWVGVGSESVLSWRQRPERREKF
jgi:hypothetical protein